jgi:hypothetical protein
MHPNKRIQRAKQIQKRNRERQATRQTRSAGKVADHVPILEGGRPAVLLATGPSLCREDLEYIRPLHEQGKISVFGLGDAYRLCDFMDVFYFCDPKWLELNPKALDCGAPHMWTQCAKSVAKHPNKLKRIAGSGGNGICESPHHIYYGGNSGHQLINLAWHFGVREMYLLGYNMGATDNTRKKQHFFGHHPQGLNQNNSYKSFVGSFQRIKPSIRAMITNCTEPSFLSPDVFKFVPLREALPHDEKIRHVYRRPVDDKEARSRQAAAIMQTRPKVRRPASDEMTDSSDHSYRSVPEPATTDIYTRKTYGGRVQSFHVE